MQVGGIRAIERSFLEVIETPTAIQRERV